MIPKEVLNEIYEEWKEVCKVYNIKQHPQPLPKHNKEIQEALCKHIAGISNRYKLPMKLELWWNIGDQIPDKHRETLYTYNLIIKIYNRWYNIIDLIR